ncbi:MAG: HNH endonuclease signature motif containing protein, partial [Acidimicrobiales bacterium]
CRTPATSCDLDHTHPHSQGGPTLTQNLAPLCRHDHQGKHTPGWTLTPQPHGYTWTTPHHHTYTTPTGTHEKEHSTHSGRGHDSRDPDSNDDGDVDDKTPAAKPEAGVAQATGAA